MRGSMMGNLERHLAELKERNERKKARTKKKAREKTNAYMRRYNRKQRTGHKKEVAELIRVIKDSMREW